MVFVFATGAFLLIGATWVLPTLAPAVLMAGYYLFFLASQVAGAGGAAATAAYWAGMGLLALSILVLRTGVSELRRNGFMEFTVVLFLMVCLANWALVADFSAYGAKKLGFLVLMALVPFFIMKWIRQGALEDYLIFWMTSLSVIQIALTLGAYAFGVAAPTGGRFTFIEAWEPIYSAMNSGMAVLGMWWWCGRGRLTGFKLAAAGGVVVMGLLAMFLTSQRGPLLSLLLVLVLLPPTAGRWFSFKKLILAFGVLALAGTVYALNPNQQARDRMAGTFSRPAAGAVAGDTVALRRQRFEAALAAGYDRVAFGIGLGNTPEKHYAHNCLLEIWEELGITGLLIFLALIGGALKKIWQSRRNLSLPLRGGDLLWQSMFLYAFLESLISGTIFGNTLLWMSLAMVTLSHRHFIFHAPCGRNRSLHATQGYHCLPPHRALSRACF